MAYDKQARSVRAAGGELSIPGPSASLSTRNLAHAIAEK